MYIYVYVLSITNSTYTSLRVAISFRTGRYQRPFSLGRVVFFFFFFSLCFNLKWYFENQMPWIWPSNCLHNLTHIKSINAAAKSKGIINFWLTGNGGWPIAIWKWAAYCLRWCVFYAVCCVSINTVKMSLDTQYFYLMMFALVSLLAFRVVCIALKSTISPPNVVSSTKEWLYFNTLISFLHACISGLSSIYWWVFTSIR